MHPLDNPVWQSLQTRHRGFSPAVDARKLPFLHVSNRNVRAKALYERLGYRQRIDINLWSLKRLPNDGGPP